MRPTKKSGEVLREYVKLAKKLKKPPTRTELEAVISERQIRKHFGSITNLKEVALKGYPELKEFTKLPMPKILVFDIETAPILGFVWDIWDQNVGLNQIKSDWHVLSWSAKWLGSPPEEVMYMDQRKANKIEDDSQILRGIWKLLDEADVVITQNGKKFDVKKLNARFIKHGFQPPSSFKHIDTFLIAKKHFGFTSNKLEYMTGLLCTKYKKLKHEKFSGFEMWKECLAGNIEAWNEMEKYNKYDVLSLEELYTKLIPWETSINFNLYHESEENICSCGSSKIVRNEYYYTTTGKFFRYTCKDCGAEYRGTTNVFDKEKKKSLKRGTVR